MDGNIDFAAGKCRFLNARVGTSKSALMHWKPKLFIFLYENMYFWKQKMFSWKHGGAKYWFSCRKIKVFGRGPKTARMDEDGWLEAWERKILISLQENVNFWKQKRVWMWLGNAKY